jgi:serine/threonine protein kinase
LKPENVLIDSDGYCVLSDFGLSQYADSENQSMQNCVPKKLSEMSEPNFGTPEYLPPE